MTKPVASLLSNQLLHDIAVLFVLCKVSFN